MFSSPPVSPASWARHDGRWLAPAGGRPKSGPAGHTGRSMPADAEGGAAMKTSSERVLTTHTGSLPRPARLTDRHDQQAVKAAVQDAVERQLAAGVDVINDGEASKPSYSTYVTERLAGFGGEPVAVRR